jgi:hypothetical protein
MTQASIIAAEIEAKLPLVKSGSLSVWGDIFGGRIDNFHVITSASARAELDQLVIGFNHGETLEVWGPQGATISVDEFHIDSALRVRWEWFYYGRPEVPANRRFIEHAIIGGAVVTTDMDRAASRSKLDLARAAVELLGFE